MSASERAKSISYAYEEHGLISLYNVFKYRLPLEFHTNLGVQQPEQNFVTQPSSEWITPCSSPAIMN